MSQTKAQLISDLVQALNFTGTATAPANGLFLSASNQLKFATASTERLKIDGTEVVVNDTGASVDFRIEGDTDTNLFVVDASADAIGIGAAPITTGAKFEVTRNTADAFVNASDCVLRLLNTNTSANTNQTSLQFTTFTTGSGADSAIVSQAEDASGNSRLEFWTDTSNGMSEKMSIASNGTVTVGGNLDVGGNITVSNSSPRINLTDTGGNDFMIIVDGDDLNIQDTTAGQNRFNINSGGTVSCNFGLAVTGNMTATGDLTVTGGDVIIQGVEAKLHLTDTNNDDDYLVFNNNGTFKVYDATNNADRLQINSSGVVTIGGNTDFGAGIDVTGNITGTQDIVLSSGGSERLNMTHAGGGQFVIKNPSAAALSFGTNNQDNELFIANGGNVGIGTTSPQAKLEIKGTNDGGNFTALHLRNAGGDGSDVTINMISSTDQTNTAARSFIKSERVGSAPELAFGIANIERMRLTGSSLSFAGTKNGNAYEDATLIFNIKDSNGNSKKAQILSNKSSDIHSTLEFGTTVSNSFDERMRIHTNGFVGIGTTAPSTRLHVAVNSSETTRTSHGTVFIKNTNNGASTCASLHLQASNTDSNIHKISTQKHAGGSGSDFHIDKGTLARMQMSGDNGDIKFGVDGTMIGTFTPGLSNTTTGMGLEPRNGSIFLSRSNGAVLYCNTNTDGSQLATFRRNGNEQGKIIAHSSSVSYETTSDYRLKENAVEISDGITRLKQLKPYRFNFKSNSSETLDGFFAHEAQTVVPECASGTKDQVVVQAQVDSEVYKESELGNPIYQGIDQSKLVPLLVAAVKELTARVETLEAA